MSYVRSIYVLCPPAIVFYSLQHDELSSFQWLIETEVEREKFRVLSFTLRVLRWFQNLIFNLVNLMIFQILLFCLYLKKNYN